MLNIFLGCIVFLLIFLMIAMLYATLALDYGTGTDKADSEHKTEKEKEDTFGDRDTFHNCSQFIHMNYERRHLTKCVQDVS